jgi:hypothetical protein
MGKRKRRKQSSGNQQQQQRQRQEQYPSMFVRWGILSIVGSIILFASGLVFIYTVYYPSHPGVAQRLPVFTILEAPLIIEGLLFIIGLASLIYGLRQRR